MTEVVADYYRCPEHFLRFSQKACLSGNGEYFHGEDRAQCFGESPDKEPNHIPVEAGLVAQSDIEITDGVVYLAFDPSQAVQNLRYEKYVNHQPRDAWVDTLAELYYLFRPILPVTIRKHLQRVYLSGWKKISFPQWPVDTSVDSLMEKLLLSSVQASQVEYIPFIWFWPRGSSSCAILTHDVETAKGRDLCADLMDIDDAFGVKASFQIIPEERYNVDELFLSLIRNRGFEVVIHDLNHDGHLYRTQEGFLRRASKINAYGKQYGAEGFRAGVLYRQQAWFEALDFAYDMSVPNVAHLDPQRGGCCTVMPYFIGDIVELPVTTTQDYTLFNILNEYSLDLWDQQIELIKEKHGLINLIIHPDYIMGSRERQVYEALLDRLACLRETDNVWLAKPGEVNRWWRKRAKMQLVETAGDWQIKGDGADEARIAYASEKDGHLFLGMHAPRGRKDIEMKVQ